MRSGATTKYIANADWRDNLKQFWADMKTEHGAKLLEYRIQVTHEIVMNDEECRVPDIGADVIETESHQSLLGNILITVFV